MLSGGIAGKIIGGGDCMPALFDTTKMSPDEFKFIRIYCAAVRRDFDAMSTALVLTDPVELGLTCPFTVAKLAFGLQGMQREYRHRFVEVGAKHVMNKSLEDCLPSAVPSLDDVGRIFSVSFFKIVDSDTKLAIVTAANNIPHDGWSSGRPSDWQYSLKSLYEIQKQQKPLIASGLNLAFQKLFSIFLSYNSSKSPTHEVLDYEDDYDYDYDEEDDDHYFN